MVIPMLMMSYRVSLNPKIGPLMPQTTIRPTATMKVGGRPAPRTTAWANVSKLII